MKQVNKEFSSPGFTQIFYVIVFSLLFSFTANSQSQKNNSFSLIHLNEENSVVENNTISIADDKYGYLWIVGSSDFMRYDGRNFKKIKYPANPSDGYALYKNYIGDIYLFNRSKNIFYLLNVETGSAKEMPLMKRKNNCYFSSSNFVINLEDYLHVFNSLSVDTFKSSLLKGIGETISDFFYADSSSVYLVADSGIVFIEKDKVKKIKIPGISWKKKFMVDGILFLKDSNEVFDAYSKGNILYKQKKMQPGRNNTDQKKIFHSGTLLHLNNASFIQSDNRLYKMVVGLDFIPVCFLLNTDQEIKNPVRIGFHEIYKFYYITTYINGIYMLFPKQFKTIYNKNDPSENSFFAQLELDDSSLYTPTRRIEKNGEILQVSLVDSAMGWGLYHDKEGNIWGSTRSCIFKFNYKTQKLNKYLIHQAAICFESEGDTLWFATRDRIGYILQDMVHFVYDFKNKSPNINHIKRIKNNIYISSDLGFYKFNISNRSLIPISELAEKTVYNACLLPDSSMFIAVSNDRPYYYYKEKVYPLPLDKEGKLSISYYGIYDKKGFIWIPSSKGLFQVKKSDIDNFVTGKNKHLYYFYYDKKNGFNSNEFNGGACNPGGLIKYNGEFSLSSLNGMVWFKPESIVPSLPKASIRIDHIKVDSLLLDALSEIKIQSGFNHLLFEISVPYFDHPNNLIVEYSLEGLDNEWYPVASDGKILFTSLSAGAYFLKVRKINGFGIDNYSYINCKFIVLP
nr:hypothetical protein [Bacteroidota bacterium]